jgi:hypothetical protein
MGWEWGFQKFESIDWPWIVIWKIQCGGTLLIFYQILKIPNYLN